jgi:hypothetical protein
LGTRRDGRTPRARPAIEELRIPRTFRLNQRSTPNYGLTVLGKFNVHVLTVLGKFNVHVSDVGGWG